MTNAEKYLKEGIDVEKFIKELAIEGLLQADYDARDEIRKWLYSPYIELTWDEKKTIKENLDEIAHKITEFKYDEKEKASLQFVIKEQQEQIDELKWRLNIHD